MDKFEEELVSSLPIIRRRALKLCKNNVDANDLVQETALRALQFRHLYSEEGNFLGWLSAVMRNQWSTGIRARCRKNETPMSEVPEVPIEPSQDDLIEFKEIMANLAKMPDYHRRALLYRGQGLDYGEIAKIYDVPLGTIKSRINRAREMLKRKCTA